MNEEILRQMIKTVDEAKESWIKRGITPEWNNGELYYRAMNPIYEQMVEVIRHFLDRPLTTK